MENLTEIFLKSRGHKYLRKVPDGHGGWRYIYTEPTLRTTPMETREQKYKQHGWDYSTTSKTEYAGDPKRKQLHKKTVADYVARSSRQGKQPVAVFTLGGSGAGKSTVLKLLEKQDPLIEKIVRVDSDDIKTQVFKEDFEAYNKQDEGSAAGRLHEESSDLANDIVDAILRADNDFLQDGTMKTYRNAERDILRAKERGYRTDVIGVTIPVEEALRRAKARAAHTGRKVPERIVVEAHVGSTNTFLKLIETGLADSLKLYDNAGSSPILIYDSTDAKNPIKNLELFEQFKNKRNYAMANKDNIEKSYDFGKSEFNRDMKRIHQAQVAKGLPVSVDVPNDADAEDLAYIQAFTEWLNDGQPVD